MSCGVTWILVSIPVFLPFISLPSFLPLAYAFRDRSSIFPGYDAKRSSFSQPFSRSAALFPLPAANLPDRSQRFSPLPRVTACLPCCISLLCLPHLRYYTLSKVI